MGIIIPMKPTKQVTWKPEICFHKQKMVWIFHAFPKSLRRPCAWQDSWLSLRNTSIIKEGTWLKQKKTFQKKTTYTCKLKHSETTNSELQDSVDSGRTRNRWRHSPPQCRWHLKHGANHADVLACPPAIWSHRGACARALQSHALRPANEVWVIRRLLRPFATACTAAHGRRLGTLIGLGCFGWPCGWTLLFWFFTPQTVGLPKLNITSTHFDGFGSRNPGISIGKGVE